MSPTAHEFADDGVAPLLGGLRAAERDIAAAEAASAHAAKAVGTAQAAEDASADAMSAADAARLAAQKALGAATSARSAAARVSDGALMAAATAQGDSVRADEAVLVARRAEGAARLRFHSCLERTRAGPPPARA